MIAENYSEENFHTNHDEKSRILYGKDGRQRQATDGSSAVMPEEDNSSGGVVIVRGDSGLGAGGQGIYPDDGSSFQMREIYPNQPNINNMNSKKSTLSAKRQGDTAGDNQESQE